MGIVIKGINPVGTGKFIIIYEEPASPCECRMIRKTYIVSRNTKPSEKTALKLISEK